MDESTVAKVLALFESSEQLMAVFDESDSLRWCNSAFRRVMGLGAREFPTWEQLLRLGMSRQQGTRIVTDDFEAWLASAKSRRGKRPFRTIEADMVDGRWILMGETTVPSGWMLCIGTDITSFFTDGRALRQARDQAQRAALSDDLTGLANRRHLMQQLQTLAAAPGAGYCLVLLDIDHFKRVNDSHGHDVGDLVLRHFAEQLRLFTRRDDMAARWGGEEFAVLLPDAIDNGVVTMLERLMQRLRQAQPCDDLPQLRYTVSAGVALAMPGEPVEGALKRADQALYAAKAGGRDRWVIAG